MSDRTGMRMSRSPTMPETPRSMRAYVQTSYSPSRRAQPASAAPRAVAPAPRRASSLNDYRDAVQAFPVTFVIVTSAVAAFAGYMIGAFMTRRQIEQGDVPFTPPPSSIQPLPPIPPPATTSPAAPTDPMAGNVSAAWVSGLLLAGLLVWGSGIFSAPKPR